MADTCAFGSLKEEMIKDWLLCGVSDSGPRKKLLQEAEFILEKCMNYSRWSCKQTAERDWPPANAEAVSWMTIQKGKGNENVQKLWQKTWVRNGEMPSIWQNLYKVFQTKPLSFCLPTNKTGGKLQLEVDNKLTPVVIPPQRVPVAIKVRLKEELDHLESLEVTRREDEPAEWVSSMVVTQKPNGKVRVCLDPKHLNQAWKRRH